MFQPLIDKRPVFVCRTCRAERFGSEKKVCAHNYRDYIIKDGKTYQELFPPVEDTLPF